MFKLFRLVASILALLALSHSDLGVAQTAASGSLVYFDSTRIGVMNLATGKTKFFEGLPFAKNSGVSVSETGVIAQLQDRSRTDSVLIHLTKLDGTFINEFTWTEQYSSLVSGARISRDGTLVAFALSQPLDGRKRGDRMIACETKPSQNHRCVYFDNLRDPAWLPDNRLVGINYEKQIYISKAPINVADPASNFVNPVGPDNLDRARTAETTPDGRFVIFSSNARPPRVYALNLQSGLVKTLTADGLGQYSAVVSSDGKSLYFLQECCQTRPGLAGGVYTRATVHRIALNTGATTSTPYAKNFLKDAGGDSVSTTKQYGVTSKTLR